MDRRAFWSELTDYPKTIVSLWHRPAARQAILDLLPPLDRLVVADLGTGPGYFLDSLSAAKRLYAVDWSRTMLSEARNRYGEQATYIEANLDSLALPEQVDVALSLNSVMPEGHEHATRLLRSVLGSVKDGGRVILVLPSMESRLYVTNAEHFHQSMEGNEEASVQRVMKSYLGYFNNPLGYVKHREEQVTKYWIAEELEELVRTLVPSVSIKRCKVPVLWKDYSREASLHDNHPPPWMWGFSIRR